MSAIRGHDTTSERLVRAALHRHGLRFRLPVRNRAWWAAKLRRNRARDRRNLRDLRAAGWRVIVVWECELGVARGNAIQRAARLERFGRTLVRKVTGRGSGR
jgi:DNA mismatch endonuclease (patch repair protein)